MGTAGGLGASEGFLLLDGNRNLLEGKLLNITI